VRAVRTLCARRVYAQQQLLARCENVMDAVKTLWERRVDAVRTLCTRYRLTCKFDIFRRISRRSHSAVSWF